MKITKVHLRWHKSFNTNTQDYSDRNKDAMSRPWNELFVPPDEGPYDFIEIPLERDITTIVGANESGKSHLLDAISKVLRGYGNDDRFAFNDINKQEFSVVDLCHFAAVRGKNADVFSNIGLSFGPLDAEEAQRIKASLPPFESLVPRMSQEGFTLIVAPRLNVSAYAYAFVGSEHIELTEPQLDQLRQHLPDIKFIKSNVPLSDEISLEALAAAYNGQEQHLYTYDPAIIKQVAEELRALTPWSFSQWTEVQQKAFLDKVRDLQNRVAGSQIDYPSKGHLEALLFDKILGISPQTILTLSEMPHTSRPYIEGFATTWNNLIKKELNLSQYWQQDPFFALQVNIKRGIIYFQITDKTGAVYSFGERSSGLRYFLSYYVQAKALEKAATQRDTIILMDEPDSFLSTQGQRNLLSVFESLINVQSSRGKTQLVYTTHSPWLVNRNFPQRLRLVRKGDGEEGTQYPPSNSIRRYEPVRSALGVDCAQVLFLGASNLVVEGATEQFLLSELIRCFARPDNLSQLLDLNSLVMVAADSASKIPHLVRSSRYGNEVPPAVAVLVDADDEGQKAIEELHQVDSKGHSFLSPQMTTTIARALKPSLTFEQEKQAIITIEDLVPTPLYRAALLRYFEQWQGDFHRKHKETFENFAKAKNGAEFGNVQDVKNFLQSLSFNTKGIYDKLGIAQTVAVVVQEILYAKSPEKSPLHSSVVELNERLLTLCACLRSLVVAAESEQRGLTGSDNVSQNIRSFLQGRPYAASLADIRQLMQRLEKETEILGVDGQKFVKILAQTKRALHTIEQSGQTTLQDEQWQAWKMFLAEVQRNPLSATTKVPSTVRFHRIIP